MLLSLLNVHLVIVCEAKVPVNVAHVVAVESVDVDHLPDQTFQSHPKRSFRGIGNVSNDGVCLAFKSLPLCRSQAEVPVVAHVVAVESVDVDHVPDILSGVNF